MTQRMLSCWMVLLACSAVAFPGLRAFAGTGTEGGEWRVWGGDKASTMYSPLDQINTANAKDLEIAWRWKSADYTLEKGKSNVVYHYEATPLMVGGVLYMTTSMGLVAAIEPTTGETLWTYDPKTYESYPTGRPANLGYLSRGIGYWTDGEKERLLHAPSDAYLISIDIKTHKPDPAFGDNGRIDLLKDIEFEAKDRRAFLSLYATVTAPIICRDVVLVGASIRDTPTRREIPPWRAVGYDVRTGARKWVFNTIPHEGEFGNETWENDSWKSAGSVNCWPPMSADEELGYFYLPIGTPSHNWYGGHRLGDNLFATSLLCLDATTGKRVWHFQFIHHPIWDYDPPAAPVLLDITVGGKAIKAVAQVTKQGWLFTFDRVTGEPVWPIEERPVPQSDIQGERTAATQPFPTKPAPFMEPGLTEDNLIDFTPELRAEALKALEGHDWGSIYQPPSERGALINPGWSGGGNWNGAPFDPETHIIYIPAFSDYTLVTLVKPDAARSNFDYVWSGADVPKIDGLSILKPPYGRITAINMDTGEHVWQVANGEGPRTHARLKDLNLPRLGRGFSDGESFTVLTKTLLFTTTDEEPYSKPMLHAYNKATGERVAAVELPGTVHAAPITYMAGGKQYIAVAVGGGFRNPEPQELVALSLP